MKLTPCSKHFDGLRAKLHQDLDVNRAKVSLNEQSIGLSHKQGRHQEGIEETAYDGSRQARSSKMRDMMEGESLRMAEEPVKEIQMPRAGIEQPAARRSSRHTVTQTDDSDVLRTASAEVQARLELGPEWRGPVVFPRNPPHMATVEFQDLKRLNEGFYLNDNLIEFYLRYIQSQHPQFDKDVYIFNTYFYESLKKKSGRTGINYDAVKRWTNKIDLFGFNYVVVPVNENLHWYLAIICNLRNLKLCLVDDEDGAIDGRHSPMSSQTLQVELANSPANKHSSVEKSTTKMSQLSLDSDVAEEGEDLAKGARRRYYPGKRLERHTPSIIILDSLGFTHAPIVHNLGLYLAAEAKDKRGATVDKLPGLRARGIPEQDNYSDCGVFALGYLKHFMAEPAGFVASVLQRELSVGSGWQDTTEPLAMRRQILHDLQAEQRHQEKARRELKAASKMGRAAGPAKPVLVATATEKNKAARLESVSVAVPAGHTSSIAILSDGKGGESGKRRSHKPSTFAEVEAKLLPGAAAGLAHEQEEVRGRLPSFHFPDDEGALPERAA